MLTENNKAWHNAQPYVDSDGSVDLKLIERAGVMGTVETVA
jgi:hypothetical protein